MVGLPCYGPVRFPTNIKMFVGMRVVPNRNFPRTWTLVRVRDGDEMMWLHIFVTFRHIPGLMWRCQVSKKFKPPKWLPSRNVHDTPLSGSPLETFPTLCHVPLIGSCSQFCLILQPHCVAVPFPPTFASPWRNNFVEGKIWDHPSTTTQEWPKLGGGVI